VTEIVGICEILGEDSQRLDSLKLPQGRTLSTDNEALAAGCCTTCGHGKYNDGGRRPEQKLNKRSAVAQMAAQLLLHNWNCEKMEVGQCVGHVRGEVPVRAHESDVIPKKLVSFGNRLTQFVLKPTEFDKVTQNSGH